MEAARYALDAVRLVGSLTLTFDLSPKHAAASGAFLRCGAARRGCAACASLTARDLWPCSPPRSALRAPVRVEPKVLRRGCVRTWNDDGEPPRGAGLATVRRVLDAVADASLRPRRADVALPFLTGARPQP